MRAWLAVVGIAIASLAALAPSAQADASDPLFVFLPPQKGQGPTPPPGTGFNGPCGLAAGSGGLWVSDYYHNAVDLFQYAAPLKYLSQIANVDAADGPCGLALNSTGSLYVNDYHRNVSVGGVVIDANHPTGVAVDTTTDDVYVNDRTYVAVYDDAGNPVLDGGGQPLQIGLGDLEDGYGAAADDGRVYIADAATRTVKVYEPATDAETPVLTISGPGLGFTSLRDAAIAVDRGSGKIYVADNLEDGVAERPEAVIQVFSSAGAYLGRLKFGIVDGGPPGLAVGPTGTVYVTSGNTDQASIYGYGPNAETQTAAPAALSLSVSSDGDGSGAVVSGLPFGVDCASTCSSAIRGGAEVVLAAEPDPGSVFTGWSGGGCSGAGACAVTMDAAQAVSASFGQAGSGVSESGLPTGSGAPASVVAPQPSVRHRLGAKRHPRGKHRHRHHRHKGIAR